MSELNQLFTLDIKNAILFIAILILVFDKFAGVIAKWVPKLGIKTKAMLRDEEQDKKLQEFNTLILNQQKEIKLLTELIDRNTTAVDEVKSMMEDHISNDKKKTISSNRSTLYRLHKEFMEQGFVTVEGLKVFKECGKTYTEAGGDDIYHTKLEPEVMGLQIHYDEDELLQH